MLKDKNDEEAHGKAQKIGKTFAARLKISVVIIAVISSIGFGTAYLYSISELNKLKSASTQTVNQEASELIEKIGKHMVLPDEKPTIATVEDVNRLKEQSFFKTSQNGDKVLMYTQHRKAILYRPSADKVIEVSYLNVKGDAK